MIPFVDLQAQYEAIGEQTRQAIDRVLNRAWYILGEELDAFESEFAAFLGTDHCVGVGSGTDAIHLALRALAEAITEDTKAVIPVHLYGHPADMDPILKVARIHGVKVVEDCAQANICAMKAATNQSLLQCRNRQ